MGTCTAANGEKTGRMRILVGKGERAGAQAMATVGWIEGVGLIVVGPGEEEVAALMERDYRRWFDPASGGRWITLDDEELVRSLLFRLPRPQWWAVEIN